MKKRYGQWGFAALMLILVFLMTAWPAFAEETDGEEQTEEVVTTSGQFGPTSTWNYDEETETLYIEGTGGSFDDTAYPWNWQEIWPRKVVIGEGITSIEDSVFSNCTGLDDIRLPETLRHIGAYAFECCEIEFCYLPDGISDIDPKAFTDMNCVPTLLFSASNQYALNYAKQYGIRYKIRKNGDGGTFGKGLTWELKNGVLTITGNGPMPNYKWNRKGTRLGRPWEKYISQITDIVIGDGITHIGNNSFAYLETGSVNLTIQGNTLVSIGKGGFDNTRVKAIDLPDSVEVLGEDALSGTAITKLILPAGLKRIGECCFDYNRDLETVIFKGTGLTEIPESAFDSCGMETISLPAGIVKIGPDAFENCDKLRSIEIPDTVKSIGESVFFDDWALKEIRLPQGLQRIEDSTFRQSGLTEIVLPDSVRRIGRDAFRDCEFLESVSTLDRVEYIGSEAFRGCKSLESAGSLDSTEFIGYKAFAETPYGDRLPGPDENGFVIYGSTLVRYTGNKAHVTIPKGITTVGEYAFTPNWKAVDKMYSIVKPNKTLKQVDFPDSLKYIGDSAFEKCKVLTGARIPAGVRFIGYSAFEDCSKLKTLKLPEGTGKSGEGIVLENRIFEGCSSLKSVTIPANIRELPQDIFCGCKKLSRVTCKKPLDSIGPYAFEGCAIRKIPPTTNKYKLVDTGTFENCKKLNNVKVPSSVKEISYIAFGGCKSLRIITIPASVKVIDDQAFAQGSRDVANVRTIRGAAGSKAQKYAKKHHLRFVKL